MTTSTTTDSGSSIREMLLAEAKQYILNRKKILTVNAEKHPTLIKWTPLRKIEISIEQVENWLESPEAQGIAVLLNKSLLAFDYDGQGEDIVWGKLVPRCNPDLQNAFNRTT